MLPKGGSPEQTGQGPEAVGNRLSREGNGGLRGFVSGEGEGMRDEPFARPRGCVPEMPAGAEGFSSFVWSRPCLVSS